MHVCMHKVVNMQGIATHIQYFSPLFLRDGFYAVERLIKASKAQSINGLTHAHLAHVNGGLLRHAAQNINQASPNL